MWSALPLSGDLFHAKYARNELYTFVPPFADAPPGLENATVAPIPGDVCCFDFAAGTLPAEAHGYEPGEGGGKHRIVDLAVFYGRNNLLLNGDVGWVPGTVFAVVEDGLASLAAAGNDVWRNGFAGERLAFAREESR